MDKWNNNKGITLLEVILSLVIVSIIIFATTLYFQYHLVVWKMHDERLDIKQNVQIGLNYIERRIRQCNAIGITYDDKNKVFLGRDPDGKLIRVDLSGKYINSPNTWIYFYRSVKQIRVNKNGEHNVLAQHIQDIIVREIIKGQLIEVEVFADRINYSAKTRIRINYR